MAAAAFDHHVFIFFQYDIGVIVEIQYGYGREFSGGTAGFGDDVRVHEMH